MAVVQERFSTIEKRFDSSRKQTRLLKDKFISIKTKRLELFLEAYNQISSKIDYIYKQLTIPIPTTLVAPMESGSQTEPLGGTAYLTLEDNEVQNDPLTNNFIGAVSQWYQIPCYASLQTIW